MSHKTEETFKTAQKRDKDKKQYCIDNNIQLIVIPHTIKDLEAYITDLIIQV